MLQTKADQVAAMNTVIEPFVAAIKGGWRVPHSTQGMNAPWGEWRRSTWGITYGFASGALLVINPDTGNWYWCEHAHSHAADGLWLGNGRQPLSGFESGPLPLHRFTQLLEHTQNLCQRTLGVSA